MSKVHSHYENLKVARDASTEEIRAAYRTLTRQYHPDRNPDNADAERVMSVINVAYGTLSDPRKRAEHDRWIAEEESPRAKPLRHGTTLHRPSKRFQETGAGRPDLAARQAALDRRMRRVRAHLLGHRMAYGVAVAALLGGLEAGIASLLTPGLHVPVADLAVASPVPVVTGYKRPELAPSGHPWPTHSGYVEGYPQMSKGGEGQVVVDNTENDVDMFGKLVALDSPTAYPVRVFYVARHSRFVLSGLVGGTYDLRYRNLASGALTRSPALILEEVATAEGVQHGKATVKLYQSAGGNMLSYALPEADF